MSSDYPQIVTLETAMPDLTAAINTALPTLTTRDMANGITNNPGVVLYIDQGDLATSMQGQQLAPGSVQLSVNLALASRYKDPAKALKELNARILALLPVLDQIPFLHWTTAQRGVLDDTGTPCYIIPALILTTYPAPVEPEPTTPETPEE